MKLIRTAVRVLLCALAAVILAGAVPIGAFAASEETAESADSRDPSSAAIAGGLCGVSGVLILLSRRRRKEEEKKRAREKQTDKIRRKI